MHLPSNGKKVLALGFFFLVTGLYQLQKPQNIAREGCGTYGGICPAHDGIRSNLTTASTGKNIEFDDHPVEDISFDPKEDENLGDRLQQVDIAQVLLLDYFQDPSKQTVQPTKSNFSLVHSYAVSLNDTNYDRADFSELARRGRAAYISFLLNENPKELYSLVSDISTGTTQQQLNQILEKQTVSLFPFVAHKFKSITEMHALFASQEQSSFGIAITCGTSQFYITYHVILSLRQIFGIYDPIEVFYAGYSDLRPKMVETLNKLKNVKTVNLLRVFPQEASEYSSWSLKPFAILAASFKTVMYMDTDVLFFSNPLQVLDSNLFKKHGQLYYHDRTMFDPRTPQGPGWFQSLLTSPSPSGRSLRYLTDKTAHEMDSGFMVFDKSRPGILFSLLLTCRMNSKIEREKTLYENTYGDKESFWFANELLRVPYAFNPYFGGTFGYYNVGESQKVRGRAAVCGIRLLQLNESGDPFFWNGGGVLKDRKATVFEFLDFERLALGVEGGDPKGEYFGDFCFRQADSLVWSLTEEQMILFERYKAIYLTDVSAISSFL
ncbi:mannosyltransferase putative-domain-containing protein [Obelidium mucronatum]|nr:mannosyltransferase putative-domain-containing protein [Obelidium mucronatum]